MMAATWRAVKGLGRNLEDGHRRRATPWRTDDALGSGGQPRFGRRSGTVCRGGRTRPRAVGRCRTFRTERLTPKQIWVRLIDEHDIVVRFDRVANYAREWHLTRNRVERPPPLQSRGWLSHVDQNYLRPDTSAPANTALIDAQAGDPVRQRAENSASATRYLP